MIAVKVPQRKSKYGFTFLYYDEKDKDGNYLHQGRPVECRIIKNGEIFANGVATLYYSDIYNRRFGRKLAFIYALVNAKFTRKIRTVFWEVFLEKCLL